MRPTLGRMVHVVWADGVESPAVITRTDADTVGERYSDMFGHLPADRWNNLPAPTMSETRVDLMVFGLSKTYPLYNVPQSDTKQPGHWHWPERED